jgi:hypothetical protein
MYAARTIQAYEYDQQDTPPLQLHTHGEGIANHIGSTFGMIPISL